MNVPPALSETAQRLTRGLSAAGFDVDPRAYAPHLTLARKCRAPRLDVPAPCIAWKARELTLVESVLRPAGPDYRIESRWLLGGACVDGD